MISSTCKCVLNGECATPQPMLRRPFNDSKLRYCPEGTNGKYWKWVPQTRYCRSDKQVTNRRLLSVKLSGQEETGTEGHNGRILRECAPDNGSAVFLSFDDAFDCPDDDCTLHWDFLDTRSLVYESHNVCSVASLRRSNTRRVAIEYFRRGHTLSHTHANAASSSMAVVNDIAMADAELTRLTMKKPKLQSAERGIPARTHMLLCQNLKYTLWSGINGAD